LVYSLILPSSVFGVFHEEKVAQILTTGASGILQSERKKIRFPGQASRSEGDMPPDAQRPDRLEYAQSL
jgi:hypothetical protein